MWNSRRVSYLCLLMASCSILIPFQTHAAPFFNGPFFFRNTTGQTVFDLETIFAGTEGTIQNRRIVPPNSAGGTPDNTVNSDSVNLTWPTGFAPNAIVGFSFQSDFLNVKFSSGNWTNDLGDPIAPAAQIPQVFNYTPPAGAGFVVDPPGTPVDIPNGLAIAGLLYKQTLGAPVPAAGLPVTNPWSAGPKFLVVNVPSSLEIFGETNITMSGADSILDFTFTATWTPIIPVGPAVVNSFARHFTGPLGGGQVQWDQFLGGVFPGFGSLDLAADIAWTPNPNVAGANLTVSSLYAARIVPEPTTLVLVSAGLGALALVASWRTRRSQ